MERISKKDFLSIPNILGYFRILLIPIFTWVYVTAGTKNHLYLAALVVLISGLTDLADGFIARRFNMVTELGKFIDPLADKLTQIAVIFCLTSRYNTMWILFALCLIKESYMFFKGVSMLRKGKRLDGASMCGKVCTAILYSTMFILLVFVDTPLWLANLLVAVCAVDIALTLYFYVCIYKTL